jgi:undecaprenol kinase
MSRFRKSLKHAFDGLWYVAKYERNFQIELVLGAFIGALILILKLKGWEAIVLILMIMWVLITELTNTVFEKVVDILKPRLHPYARVIKDIMAAVVLISCLVAIIVGIIIFLPYVREMKEGVLWD